MGDQTMRSRPHERCIVCGSYGEILYRDLRDRLFGTAGTWTLRRCMDHACRLIWIDPLPLADDIASAYEHYYTHRDSAAPDSAIRNAYETLKRAYAAARYDYPGRRVPWWAKILVPFVYLHPGRRAVMDFHVMWLRFKAGGRLLDVGCGSGTLLVSMQELGWTAEGVDLDSQAAQNARKKGVTVHLGELAAQNFGDDTFDAVTMSHFLEHVHHPLALLEECYRILKPGGRLVIVTPNTDSLGHRIYRDHWRSLEPPRHLHLFNVQTLRRLVQRAGYAHVNAFTSIRDAHGTFIASRALKREGSYIMGSRQSLRVRLWARVMELAEWVLLKVQPNAGEELVLIARK